MLDKLGSFCSHAMTKIWILVDTYYLFYMRPNILDYIAKLLEKDKFLCYKIENIGNQRHYYRSFASRLTKYK